MKKLRRLFTALCGTCLCALLVITLSRPGNSPILRSEKLLAERYLWDPDLPLDENQKCRFPQPDPWDESIRRFVYDPTPIRCRRVQPEIAYVTNGTLRINRTEVSDAGFSPDSITCSYQRIVRPLGKDDEVVYGPEMPLPVSDDVGVMLDVDMVAVKCTNWLRFSVYNHILTYPRPTRRKIVRTVYEERPKFVLGFGKELSDEVLVDFDNLSDENPKFVRISEDENEKIVRNSEKNQKNVRNSEKIRNNVRNSDDKNQKVVRNSNENPKIVRNSYDKNQKFVRNSEDKKPKTVRNSGKKPKIVPKPPRPVRHPINILAFGIDSMSRSNMMRQLPLTYKHLTRHMNSVVLHGMTRIGDNTYPNLMAALTGQATNRPPKGVYFDHFPLIWKNFSDAGYTTLLAEDVPEFSVFNYGSSGFYQQPTDHYFRPFYVAIQRHSNLGLSSNLCFGPKPKHVIHMEFIKNLISAPNKKPFFVFSFLTEISHNLLNQIGIADQDFLDFLRDLERDLEDTVVFFFGDHGHRIDDIRMTPIGRIEGSMPFFSVFLPKKLKTTFLDADRNLRTNSMRLTTMFDVHETFLDIFRYVTVGTGLGDDFPHVSPWGLSLFREIPAGRTCKMAGVRDQFCMCATERELNLDDKRTTGSAENLVKLINEITSPFRDICAELNVNLVLNSRLVLERENGFDKVRVVVEVSPGRGVFEGIVLFGDGVFKASSDVDRINQYKGQDWCLTEEMKRDKIDLRKFCFCV